MNRTMKFRKVKVLSRPIALYSDRIVKEVISLLGQELFTINECRQILSIHNSYAYVVHTLHLQTGS